MSLTHAPQNSVMEIPASSETITSPTFTIPASPANLTLVGSARQARWNDLTWRQDAACINVETEIFFPVGLNGESLHTADIAKSVCASCPVANACLEFALRTSQDYGVWGGHTEEERRTMRRSRRAAARKAAAIAS